MVEKKSDEAAKTKEEKKTTAKSSVIPILDAVKQMTVMELAELVKALEEEFGVTASAPMMVAAPGGASAAQAAQVEEEKTEFNAQLTEIGANKIQVIKVVRTITGLGLKEAKNLVESAPSMIKEGVGKEEAEDIKRQVEEVGATVELK